MFLKCLIFIILVIVCHQETVAAKQRKHIVCYHGTWSTYRQSLGKFDVSSDIDPFLCTHLMYAFFGIEETGDLRIIDPYLDLEDNFGRGNIRKFNALKLKNPTLKTLAAVGGWNEGSKKFSIVAADPMKRSRFVQSVIKFIQKYGFDGLDLDWEYPNQRHKLQNDDRSNFLLLIKELKEEMEPFGYILTAAVGSVKFSADLSYDIPEMMKYFEFINVMAYDLHGSWDPVVGLNAPLYASSLDTTEKAKQFSFDAIVKYWISKGAPREKLVMGVPFYGRSFTLENPSNHEIGAPHIGRGLAGQYSLEPGVIGYNELCEKFDKEKPLWHLVWDNKQQAPYAYNDRNWIGYDNEESIALKANYVMNEDLAGIMVWSVESDDFRGVCSAKRYPLLTAINDILHGTVTPVSQTTVSNNQQSTDDLPMDPVITPKIEKFQCHGMSGYVRDSKNCGKFYFCDKDVAHSFECPARLCFDLDTLACDFSK